MSIFKLSGPGLIMTFGNTDDHLQLLQMERSDEIAVLFKDEKCVAAGGGSVGNPLTVVLRTGEYKGVYGMDVLKVDKIEYDESRMLAFLSHDEVPIELAIEISVEGNVSTWRGQACWTGDEPVEADIYFPFFSRLCFGGPDMDRAVMPRVSGSVLGPTGNMNLSTSYLGNMSSPTFIIDGGCRGMAVLDDNRADFAVDPGACVRRTCIIGNDFSLFAKNPFNNDNTSEGGTDGPFVGICHSRCFNVHEYGETSRYFKSEGFRETQASEMWMGDFVDLGPVKAYVYNGGWKTGAIWLRGQRSSTPFRVSPAKWYQNTTFIGEDLCDDMLRRGQSFYDYPVILSDKEAIGANLFHVPGFHEPVKLGSEKNWLNRGDYFFAAQNLGGFEAVKKGIDAVHRQGGHILYYVEGLIMWKLSRIGISKGKNWSLMEADGTYTEYYKGFWHMCPACEEWQDWLAETCAEIIRTTGVDGFFIDSSCATDNHRCYNPEHNHPHPDVWNWGLRRMLRKIREAVDKVNPETVLFVEGAGDMAREFADGFVSHSCFWNKMTFTEPIVRFLHPEMRTYESWGYKDDDSSIQLQQFHVWNFVNGYRIYSHNPHRDELRELSKKARRYYDIYPEICDNPMSEMDIECKNCISQLYEGTVYNIVTIGNNTDETVKAEIKIPVTAGLLFDRVDSKRLPVINRIVTVELGPWEFRAFEVRV